MTDRVVVAICITFMAVLIGGIWLLGVNNVPDCQTFMNAHYTGSQHIDGHTVTCFHGNVVAVNGEK